VQDDIGAQGVAQPGDEELDLLGLDEGAIMTGEGDEVFVEVVDSPCAPQHGQLTNWTVREGGPMWAFTNFTNCGHSAIVELHAMKPQLSIMKEVECPNVTRFCFEV
jgi:hypothetical protein